MKILNVIFPLLLISLTSDIFAETSFTEGTKFLSPDGTFTLTILTDYHFQIKNNKTGELNDSNIETPIYAIKWDPNSKNVVVVFHLAGGSGAYITHFDGKQWNDLEACPKIDCLHYGVTEVTFKKSLIYLTYKFNRRAPAPVYFTFHTYSFAVNPKTGKFSDIKERQIKDTDYDNMPLL